MHRRTCCTFVTFDLHRQNKNSVISQETITFELNYYTSFSCFTTQIRKKSPVWGKSTPHLVIYECMAYKISRQWYWIYTTILTYLQGQTMICIKIHPIFLSPTEILVIFICQCNKLEYLNLKKRDFYVYVLCFKYIENSFEIYLLEYS